MNRRQLLKSVLGVFAARFMAPAILPKIPAPTPEDITASVLNELTKGIAFGNQLTPAPTLSGVTGGVFRGLPYTGGVLLSYPIAFREPE